MLAASRAEAWRQGTAGMYDHSRAVTLPWGFTPAEVGVPAGIWHGTADPEILPGMAEDLARVMPHASVTMLPGEGHLLLFTHWADILRLRLAGRLQAGAARSPSHWEQLIPAARMNVARPGRSAQSVSHVARSRETSSRAVRCRRPAR